MPQPEGGKNSPLDYLEIYRPRSCSPERTIQYSPDSLPVLVNDGLPPNIWETPSPGYYPYQYRPHRPMIWDLLII